MEEVFLGEVFMLLHYLKTWFLNMGLKLVDINTFGQQSVAEFPEVGPQISLKIGQHSIVELQEENCTF